MDLFGVNKRKKAHRDCSRWA